MARQITKIVFLVGLGFLMLGFVEVLPRTVSLKLTGQKLSQWETFLNDQWCSEMDSTLGWIPGTCNVAVIKKSTPCVCGCWGDYNNEDVKSWYVRATVNTEHTITANQP